MFHIFFVIFCSWQLCMSMPSQLSGPDLSLLQQPTAPKPAQPGLPAGSLGINLPQLSGWGWNATTAPPPPESTTGWTEGWGWDTSPPATTPGWGVPETPPGWAAVAETPPGWAVTETTPGWGVHETPPGWAFVETTPGWGVPETTPGWTNDEVNTTPGWSVGTTPGWHWSGPPVHNVPPTYDIPSVLHDIHPGGSWTNAVHEGHGANTEIGGGSAEDHDVNIEIGGESAVIGEGESSAFHASHSEIYGDVETPANMNLNTGSSATLGQGTNNEHGSNIENDGDSNTFQDINSYNTGESNEHYLAALAGSAINTLTEGATFAIGQGAVAQSGFTQNSLLANANNSIVAGLALGGRQ